MQFTHLVHVWFICTAQGFFPHCGQTPGWDKGQAGRVWDGFQMGRDSRMSLNVSRTASQSQMCNKLLWFYSSWLVGQGSLPLRQSR